MQLRPPTTIKQPPLDIRRQGPCHSVGWLFAGLTNTNRQFIYTKHTVDRGVQEAIKAVIPVLASSYSPLGREIHMYAQWDFGCSFQRSGVMCIRFGAVLDSSLTGLSMSSTILA